MNREAMQRLRLDRRLIRRSGWLTAQEIEREVEALPDVAHKATTLGEVDESGEGASGGDEASPTG